MAVSLERLLGISRRRSGAGKHSAFTRKLVPSALLLKGALPMGPARGFVGLALRLGIGDTETVMIRITRACCNICAPRARQTGCPRRTNAKCHHHHTHGIGDAQWRVTIPRDLITWTDEPNQLRDMPSADAMLPPHSVDRQRGPYLRSCAWTK